jgi:protein tyrosine/serine phosphatase
LWIEMTRSKRQRVPVCAALLLGLSLGTAYAQFSARDGLPGFYKVTEHLYRGGRPTEAGLRNLAQLGVRSVIDLQGPGESRFQEKELVESLGMRYFAMPMDRGFGVDPEQIQATLKLLENSDYGPVFVHCRLGHDRTGVVIACFRIAHDGWTNDQAIQEANAYKMNRLQISKRRFILDYRKPSGKDVTRTEATAAKAAQ